MKILSVNCFCDKKDFDILFNTLNIKPEVSIQKYFSLFLQGLISNGIDLSVISERQISYKESCVFFRGAKFISDSKIKIKYIPIVAIPVLYQLGLFFHALLYTPYYFLKEGRPDYIICDIMRFYSSFPTLLIAKLFSIKVIGYVADIPQMYHHQTLEQQPWYKKLLKKIYSLCSIYYDGYILLSKYMNEYVNPKNKPYIVIEGIADVKPMTKEFEKEQNKVRSFMYAGGLFERYGVKLLIDAFKGLNNENVELWLFGKGDLEGYINTINDPRIKFYGYRDNIFVIQKQKEAKFLINPRPSTEDFTKYSFPSKLIEYLASGTPVISTRLKSIPESYWKYLIPIEEEDTDGIRNTLVQCLNMSDVDCNVRACNSINFVKNEKNSVKQAQKVINWLNDIK